MSALGADPPKRRGPRRRRVDRYRRRKEVVRAADLVAAVLERNGVMRDVREHRVLIEWPAIVGARIAERTWPERLDGRTLWVAVESSPWLAELSFLAGDLAERVNRFAGEPPFCDEVKLTLAGRGQKTPSPVRRKRPRRVPPRERPVLSDQAAAAIAREAGAVEDAELRDIIIAARRRIGF